MSHLTVEGFGSWRTLSGLPLDNPTAPGLSLRANPGLKLANAFGVNYYYDTTARAVTLTHRYHAGFRA